MLRLRVITAVVLLAALAAALWAGTTAFAAAMSILLGAGAFEWLRLAQHTVTTALVAVVAFAVALFSVEIAGLAPEVVLPAAAATLAIWLGIAALLVRAERRGARIPHGVSTVLAFVLLGVAAICALDLMRHGVTLLLSAMAIVWVADTAAYFAGRRWGRTKLAPKISPGKTWAGAVGAVLAVLAAALAAALLAPGWPIFSTLLLQRLPLALGLTALVALVALSIVGDLFESLLKRQVGAKDSGKSLPGHGGVLDRIDALLPVLPAAALLVAGVGA